MMDNDIIKALDELVKLSSGIVINWEINQSDAEEIYKIAKNALDLVNRKDAEIENQQYILMGVMHSVDKWLDGDELKQDEVNRAATMREKTLQITEKQQAEIEKLNVELVGMRGACESYKMHYDNAQAEIERLNGRVEATEISKQKLLSCFETAKSEAIKEFAERLKELATSITLGGKYRYDVATKECIDNLVKEMTEGCENGRSC